MPQIRRALARLKRDLGVHRYFCWTGTYYQYANRLATLWFLQKQRVAVRLVFVYFKGDVFPDGTPCPQTEQDWEALIEARRLTLGLAKEHRPCLTSRRSRPTAADHAASGRCLKTRESPRRGRVRFSRAASSGLRRS